MTTPRLPGLPRLATLLTGTFIALALPACATETPRNAAEAMAAIERAIGDAPCDTDAQCRVIGVGAKACGGPERYLPWSVRYTQQPALERLVDQHRALRGSQHQRDGMMSNCAVVPQPGVQCVARRCQVQAAAAGTTAR